MPIDLSSEQVLSLHDAARTRILPRRRRGQRPHVATLYRWAKTGYNGVLLETIRVGGTLCTSVEALQRFCECLSANGPSPQGRSRHSAGQAAARPAISWRHGGNDASAHLPRTM